MFYFAQVSRGGRDTFQRIVWILCFIAFGKSHQLGRELEIWGRAIWGGVLEKNKFQQVDITPVKSQRFVCLMKQLFTNDTESFCLFLCYFSDGPLNLLWQNIFFWNIHWFLACRSGKVIWSSSVQPPTYYRPLYLLCLFFLAGAQCEFGFSKQIHALGTASEFLVYLWYSFLFYRSLGG